MSIVDVDVVETPRQPLNEEMLLESKAEFTGQTVDELLKDEKAIEYFRDLLSKMNRSQRRKMFKVRKRCKRNHPRVGKKRFTWQKH